MTMLAVLKTDGNPTQALRGLLQKLLSEQIVDALVAAAATPYSRLPMPTLICAADRMNDVNPLAPVAAFNAARQAASVLRTANSRRLALVLRPCEIRAFVELVKLKQCVATEVTLIGLECLGRMENSEYLQRIDEDGELTTAFYRDSRLRQSVCQACRACRHFQPQGVDLALWTIGFDLTEGIGVAVGSDAGRRIMSQLGLQPGPEPAERPAQLAALREQRMQEQALLLQRTSAAINTMERMQQLFATCLNCYNCRTACPVCYCKECVFMTDVFAHDPAVLLRRAKKRGLVKLPTDTTMFHLTRLAHMSHACVACGHCSSVCPSGIPVADVFQTVAHRVQQVYDYEPGRDPAEPIPLLITESRTAR